MMSDVEIMRIGCPFVVLRVLYDTYLRTLLRFWAQSDTNYITSHSVPEAGRREIPGNGVATFAIRDAPKHKSLSHDMSESVK
jgi:hypothetical protein